MRPLDANSLAFREPHTIERLLPALELLSSRYFRLRVRGREHIRDRPALFVANHNGGIFGPDLICTLGTLWRALGPEAPLYAMAHDFAMRQFTPLGRQLRRLGCLRASPENSVRVLETGGQVLVYPGGDLDAYRHFRRRNEIVLGERTGFVKIAQRHRVPIVPIVAQGAHRSAVIFTEGRWIVERLRLSRRNRIRRFPLALALPWGLAPGPWIPYLPLPLRVRLRFLPAIHVAPEQPLAEARERVRAAMQAALDEMVRQP